MRFAAILLMSAPFVVFGLTEEEWASQQADRDAFRLKVNWQARQAAEAAGRVVYVTNITTNVVARDARLVDREQKYLTELGAAGLSVTNDFDLASDALNANGNNMATLRLGLRLFTLRQRIVELGGDPKASTGRTAETNTVITETRTTPAMQRLGRAATAEDLK